MLPTNPIAALFGRSPFKPLQQHMRVVIECVSEVPALFRALIDNDQEQLEEQKNRIFVKESAADAIRADMCDHLPRSLLLAVDRQDLLELLAMQDAIADTAQDIAGLLVERRMEVPAGMAEPLMRLVARCVDTCELAHQIIEQIDELLESGFRGRPAERVQAMVIELGHMESDTDVMGMDLARALFAEEDNHKPVSVMFWYQLIQWVGTLADHAERVGEVLRLLIARR
ncbi:TIGR00153 family protein [Accumulibacter sp.]|uniref:TIGR00153 family protein n=1 Tax=Accumulibacter sp. TaxID=2053492 RepID=UPI0026229B21|nr:TIGR00153 family protein [Accumulibacter sp.]